MRLLIATGIYPPDIGGPAIHVQKLAESLIKRGKEVKIITYGNIRQPGISRISRKIPFGLRHLFYFLKCCGGAFRSDLVYAQDATAAGLPAFLAAKLFKKKFFIRIGGDILWERAVEKGKRFLSLNEYYKGNFHLSDHPIIFHLIRYILRHSEAVVVPTSLLKKIYMDFYGVNSEKIKIILNPSLREKGEGGSSNFPSEPIILFAGRFVAYKNLDLLIRIFDRLRQKVQRGHLILIGEGPIKTELKNLIIKLPSAKFIEIRPPYEQKKLFKEIRAASVCVGPALTEFNPNFILECLSFRKPVLLSRENGLSVKLPDDFLFDAKDERELGEKMARFFDFKFYKKAIKIISAIPLEQTWEKVIVSHLELFTK